MKYPGIKIFLLLALTAVAFAGQAIINSFSATPEGSDVKLEWTTGTETDVNHYSIQRLVQPQQTYVEIATIQPKGSNSYYSYTDQSIYKTNDVLFTYQLAIVDNNNNATYCKIKVSASPNISGVKRTWGSIKAMFR